MTIKIERSKKKTKKKKTIIQRLGFTNCLAIIIVLMLIVGLGGGFYLANRSISTNFTGALACWTIVFTPIGTACSIVLSRIVDKSRAENTGADGDGIKYAAAKANGFVTDEENSVESPPI